MKETYGAGSGGSHLYSVEGRLTSTVYGVRKISGNLLTRDWKRLSFISAPPGLGIPNLTLHPLRNDHLGLFTYEAARALAHWFLACPDDDATYPFHASCIEARLVQVKLSYSYSTEEIGIGEAFNNEDLQKAAKYVKRDEEVSEVKT